MDPVEIMASSKSIAWPGTLTFSPVRDPEAQCLVKLFVEPLPTEAMR